MEITTHGLKKPENEDFYNVQDFNDNTDIVESHLSDTQVHVSAQEIAEITESETLAQIDNTDSNSTLWGKVKKVISTLMSHITTVSTSANLGHIKTGTGLIMSGGTASVKLANNLTSSDTTTALTAAMGKQLNDSRVNREVYTDDLNNIPVVANILTAYRTAPTCPHAPVAEYGLVETMYIDSSSYAIQRFTSLNTSELYIRRESGGVWGNWVDPLAYSSGTATVNTTYNTQNQYTYVRWEKLGRIVRVDIYGIDTKAGYSTDAVAILASGLPVPMIDETKTSATMFQLSDGAAKVCRLAVKSDGKIWYWYNGTSIAANLNHSFSYISAS